MSKVILVSLNYCSNSYASSKANILPILPGIVSKYTNQPMGRFNLYGNIYRDTYTYIGRYANLTKYGICIVHGAEETFEYTPPTELIDLTSILYDLRYWNDNWDDTVAWCDPSDWGMININVRGRQSSGIVCPSEYHDIRDTMIRDLTKLLKGHTIVKPEELWECTGVPPDVMIYKHGCEYK